MLYTVYLLDSFFSEENTDYNIFCDNCKNNVKPHMKIEITHSPDILIIYINKVIEHKLL